MTVPADEGLAAARLSLFKRHGWVLHVLICAVVFFALVASRRWQQFVRPQVWNEDGTWTVLGFMTVGWPELITPLNGYLQLSSKLLSGLALAISVTAYPASSTFLASAFAVLVGLAIVLAPTSLRGRTLCALAVFLVPSNPEVFGLPLYSFWWASLLLFLVVLWEPGAKSVGWRIAFVLLGGLSSPVVVMILPILYWRAYQHRFAKAETAIAIAATLVAGIQFGLIVTNEVDAPRPLQSVIDHTIPKFFGTFLLGSWTKNPIPLAVVGGALLMVLIGWLSTTRERFTAAVLAYLLTGSIALAVARNDPVVLFPDIGGPRYFFLPYTCLFWILIQVAFTAQRGGMRALAAALGFAAVANGIPNWSRGHEPLAWSAHIRSCGNFERYAIPVQYDGRAKDAWWFTLPGEACAAWQRRDPIAALRKSPSGVTFPYSTRPRQEIGGSCPAKITGSTIDGADFFRSKLDGHQVIGSYKQSDADTGEIALALCRGGRILYRSGPSTKGLRALIDGHEEDFYATLPVATDWIVLDFSNAKLPATFTLRMVDSGKAFGEWLAVAVPN